MRAAIFSNMLMSALLVGAVAHAEIVTPIPPPAKISSPAKVDFLCEHAPEGTVAPMPPPFNFWVVVVCGAQSQALVPIEGMKWVAHGTDEPVSILALPPGASVAPQAKDYIPGYRVRFKSLFAAEVTDDKRNRIMTMLKEHLADDPAPAPLPKIDHIFQLDAVSIIYDMRYNIYFYISGLKPVEGIACADECKRTMFFDILSDDDAGETVPDFGLRPGK